MFKSLFGPCKDEIWAALRREIGGEVTSGKLLQGEQLKVQSGDWIVTLEEHTQMVMTGKAVVPIPHTRMRAPFLNPGKFRFSIYKASVFSYLGTLVGMQDIEVGYPDFDEACVIKGNNEELVKSLCSSERLRSLVMAQPRLHLSIQDDEGWFGKRYPPDVDVLVFNVAEHIRDVERLKGLFDVFAAVLHRLSVMGIAGQGTGAVTT